MSRGDPGRGEADGVARRERARALELGTPRGHEHVDVAVVRHGHGLPGPSRPAPEHGVLLADRDGRIVTATARHRHEAAAAELVVDVELLVARRDPGVSGSTHIWTKWTSDLPGFISVWRMPAPAVIRWASPG